MPAGINRGKNRLIPPAGINLLTLGQMFWFHAIQVCTQHTKICPAAPRGSILPFDLLFVAVNLPFVPALV